MKRAWLVPLALILIAGVQIAGSWPAGAAGGSIVIGAVYPTGGSQGSGGMEEFHGVQLAADYTNAHGGAGGRTIRLELAPADSWDATSGAVERLAGSHLTVIVGSYGSTISRPAAATATRLGLVFWETGAVGLLGMGAAPGTRVFRVPPTGGALGRKAVAFVRDHLAPRLAARGHPAQQLRYTVAYVDDVYGQAVGGGAVEEIRASHLQLAAELPYRLAHADYDALAARIAQARTDVLVVGAYLEDGVALRRAVVRARVPLLANIGTSSSYCMPVFGAILGEDAVGLFASDKPDGDTLRTDGLSPEAAEALRWAVAEYRRRFGETMNAPALAGFAGGLALFHHVLPTAGNMSAEAVAEAARRIALPMGALPNGSGLRFAPPGTPDAGANLNAASVIWEWVRPQTRAVVWPSTFATHPIVFP